VTILYKLIMCDVCNEYKDNVAENNHHTKKLTVCNTCKDNISGDYKHKLHKSRWIDWKVR